MKNKNTLGILAAVTFAVGMLGLNVSDGTIVLFDDKPATAISAAFLSGHLEIIHERDGNIISYQQTDNQIMNDGRNCASVALFGTHTGQTCGDDDSDTPGTFTSIGLSTATFVQGATVLVLANEIDDAGTLDRADGAVTDQGAATGATGGAKVTRISKTFTSDQTVIVVSAGLFNSTDLATSAMFAAKNFPTSVNLVSADTLTVNWDISISGSDAVGP